MAARENQTYLITTIVFVLLALAFLLVAILGINKATEYADLNETVQADLNYQEQLANAQKLQTEVLKSYIGDLGFSVAEVDTRINSIKKVADRVQGETQKAEINAILTGINSVKEVYQQDMAAHIGSDDPEEQSQDFTWRSLIGNLSSVLGKKHGELNIKSVQALEAQRDAESKISTMQNTVAELQKTLKKTQGDPVTEKQTNQQKQRELTDALEESRSKTEKLAGDYDNFQQAARARENNLDNQIVGLTGQNTLLKNKINVYEREVFDRPDGEIVKVAPRIQSVFIDLGRLDGLTVNRTFAVYDRTVTNFEKGRHKAMIEVISVGGRQAEARVTDEDPNNPILAGDFVLTATWDPGFRVPIALAGRFDLDGDGFDDTDKLVQMIRRNGGTVVARHDSEGTLSGKIDSDTRYLVLGESTDLDVNASPEISKATQELEDQADRNTVQVIGLNKLLNRMGVRGKPRIETLDGRIQDGFIRRPTGGSDSRNSEGSGSSTRNP